MVESVTSSPNTKRAGKVLANKKRETKNKKWGTENKNCRAKMRDTGRTYAGEKAAKGCGFFLV